MDWAGIITALIAALIPTGGLTAIVTMRDKKTASFLENVKAITEQWQMIANERQERCGELKADLDRKDDKIEEQYREKEALRQRLDSTRDDLDHCRTALAVAELMKCEKTSCTDRIPPFGQGQKVQCKLIESHENKQ